MLGWEIMIYRQGDRGASPATKQLPHGKRIAAWTRSSNGLMWLDSLVKAGRVIDLGGDGYPLKFTGTAEVLLSHLVQQQEEALPGSDYLCEKLRAAVNAFREITSNDLLGALECRPGEWLLIEAWDQS